MEFKILTQMKLSYESKKNFMELDEHETQLLAEINQALQLQQTGVIKSVCSCGRLEINVLSGICDMCWNEKFPNE